MYPTVFFNYCKCKNFRVPKAITKIKLHKAARKYQIVSKNYQILLEPMKISRSLNKMVK